MTRTEIESKVGQCTFPRLLYSPGPTGFLWQSAAMRLKCNLGGEELDTTLRVAWERHLPGMARLCVSCSSHPWMMLLALTSRLAAACPQGPTRILADTGPTGRGGDRPGYHLNLINCLLRNEPSSLHRGEAPRMTSQIPKVHTYISLSFYLTYCAKSSSDNALNRRFGESRTCLRHAGYSCTLCCGCSCRYIAI